MEAVCAFIERLAFDADRIGESNGCVLIGAGPPDLSVGHDLAPNGAAFDEWTVILHGDVGDPNALRDRGALAVARQVELCRLRKCGAGDEQQHESKHDGSMSLVHGNPPQFVLRWSDG